MFSLVFVFLMVVFSGSFQVFYPYFWTQISIAFWSRLDPNDLNGLGANVQRSNFYALLRQPNFPLVISSVLQSGHEPRLRVWELYDPKGQFAFMQSADIKHHQLGISCVVSFSLFYNFIFLGVVQELKNRHSWILVWNVVLYWVKLCENILTFLAFIFPYFQRFTPDGHIVSVGNQHDRAIVVWDWRTQQKIAENRLTSKVSVFIFFLTDCVMFWWISRC